MGYSRGRIAAVLAGAAVAAALIRACVRHGEAPEEGAASRVSEVNGVRIVTLDAAAMSGSGIVSAPLTPAAHRKERIVFGDVLEPGAIPSHAGEPHPAPAGATGTVCVRVSLPAADAASTPRSPARVTLPDGTGVAAEALDARAPGGGLVYRVPAGPSPPCPGTMLAVALPAGPELAGYLVPDSAVVWADGKAWVYVRGDGASFSRREIAADTRLGAGWFVAGGIPPGVQVVVTGAQLLFSDEFLSQYRLTEIAE
jgi:hypothetical protein